MRYSTSHKDQTHRRIIEVASRLFKERGFEATGVSLVMKEADLTNGAFYAHFASKEALIEAMIAEQIQLQIENLREVPKNAAGMKAIVSSYLTTEHRDNCGAGCPSAALLDEIARRPGSTKDKYSDNLLQLVDALQERLPSLDKDQARLLVFAIVSLLIGTLQLARSMTDRETSEQILESGRAAAFTLLESANV